MSRSSIRWALPALVGLVIAVGASVGQDSKDYDPKDVQGLAKLDAPTKKHSRRNQMPYKDGTRFIITIESPDFSVSTQVTRCVLNNPAGTYVSDWVVVSQIQDLVAKKITVVFTAVDGRKTPGVVGTGTIVITTSNGTSTTTSTPPIDVESVNIDPCP